MTIEPQYVGRMRLAVISYHSSPLHEPGAGDAGGMTVYVRELAHALAELGVATDIFTRASGDEDRATRLGDGVRVVPVEAGPREMLAKEELGDHLGDFVAGVRGYATAQRVRYDLVHSHYWQSGLAATALAAAWATPLVHSNHTLAMVKNSFLPPGDPPEPLARIAGERRVIAASDVLIASADEEWEHLSCLYGTPHDRLKVLHPGVDHSRFSPGDRDAARAALGLGVDEEVLLYVGRIQPLKGLDLAVRALAVARDDGARVPRLIAVGGESGRNGEGEIARLRALARDLGVGDRVAFVGPKPHGELPELYRAADVVVVCSHTESFGFAALEAHACGVPVVGTAVGGLSHIVKNGESGFLLRSRDPRALITKVRALLDDRARRAEFARAAESRAALFSWDASAAGFLELYECLMRETSPEVCTC